MRWYFWLGLGFGSGFASAAYVFCRWARTRVNAAIRGLVMGHPKAAAASKPRPKAQGGLTEVAMETEVCIVCGKESPRAEMTPGMFQKSRVWMHQDCKAKLEAGEA
jgi:hypothetical protein